VNDRGGAPEERSRGPAAVTVARCFALAALAMLPVYDLFTLGRQSQFNYFRPAPFTLGLAAVWLGVLAAVAVTFFAIAEVVRRVASARVQRAVFAAAALLLIPSARMLLVEHPTARLATVAFLAAISAACVVSVTASRTAASVLLVLSFLVPVQIATVAWDYIRQSAPERFLSSRRAPSAQPNRLVPASVPSAAAGRVLWLVFDELDDELTFTLRPKDVQLPAIDSLRAEAVYVSGAKSATAFTVSSMPAMLLGKPLKQAKPVDADTLRMVSDDSKPFTWRKQTSVFSDAAEAGLRTAMVGWYHPYCRVLGAELDVCEQYLPQDAHESLRFENTFQQLGFFGSIRRSVHTRLGSTSVGRVFGFRPERAGGNFFRPHRAALHTAIATSAARLAADRSVGLTVVHDNVPHHPGIYDRAADSVVWRENSNYFDNLELVDVTVAAIRNAMVAAGLWDGTTVILTSDHPLREQLWRPHHQWTREEESLTSRRRRKAIPFIIKLAGQKQGLTTDSPFDTVRTRDLLRAIRHGEISTHSDVVAWMNGR
jgi:Type I phosphodiesterase / nucleotide pyrophosphatase